MRKESRYELQKIDCNCNDCMFMERDFITFNGSVAAHQLWQFSAFELKKKRMIEGSEELAKKEQFEAATALYNEAMNLRFVFDKSECLIQYGNCSKFEKPVSFIPNTCQLDTQNCFEHRRK